jgi:hypothetical protein
MPDQLQDLLTRLKGEGALFLSGEEATRQGAVLPILGRLGWDRDNIREVVPEYTVGNGRVDYCLKIGEQVSVFVEVKRTNEELEKHQEQLLEYAFRQGVKIAVLTNGLLWWFYLPLFPGSWDQRKFFTIDIQEQEIGSAATHFMLFLSREAIASGAGLKKAEEIHAGHEKDRRIRETIPTAWRELCQKADEMLVELLAEKVESLCGHRPGEDVLGEFLAGTLRPEVSRDQPGRKKVREDDNPPGGAEPAHPGDDSTWTFKTPTGFRFKGQRYHVGAFKEILMTLSEVLHREHGRDFQKVFALRGRRRAYFGQDYKEMTEPREIPGTGIYVETCLSANAVRDRCNDLLAIFGYQPGDLQVEFRQSQGGR